MRCTTYVGGAGDLLYAGAQLRERAKVIAVLKSSFWRVVMFRSVLGNEDFFFCVWGV